MEVGQIKNNLIKEIIAQTDQSDRLGSVIDHLTRQINQLAEEFEKNISLLNSLEIKYPTLGERISVERVLEFYGEAPQIKFSLRKGSSYYLNFENKRWIHLSELKEEDTPQYRASGKMALEVLEGLEEDLFLEPLPNR